MKKHLLSFLLVAIYTGCTFAQTIPNSGFETWGIDPFSLCEFPVPWSIYTTIYDSATAVKSTDKHSGNYALKLQAKQGIASYVDLGINSKLQPTGGVKSSYLNGYYKAAISSIDTFGIAVDFFKNGVSGDVYTYIDVTPTSNVSVWTPFHISLSYPTGFTADSFAIMIYTLNASSTIVYLDDLDFNNTPIGNALGTVHSSAGVNNISKLNTQCFLFPNPAKNILTISNTLQSMKGSKIIISDIIGRKFTEQIILSDVKEYSISVDEFNTGTYFLTIQNINNESSNFKFVKE